MKHRLTLVVAMIAFLIGSVGSVAATPVTPGPNTIILDHFDGSTSGTAFGDLTFAEAQAGFGQAGQFQAGNYVQYTIGSMSQGTIEMWIKPDIALSGVGLLDINWNNTNSYPPAGHILYFWITAAGTASIAAWPAGEAIGTTPFNLSGHWTHLAGSWGPDGTKLYVNGVVDGSSLTALNVGFNPSNYVYLNDWGTSGFSGLIDDLHISNIQLAGSVIAEHAAPVPLAASVWLMGSGLLGLGLLRRRWSLKN